MEADTNKQVFAESLTDDLVEPLINDSQISTIIADPEPAAAVATADKPGPLLPFAFAKRHGVLAQRGRDGKITTLVRANAKPVSLTEQQMR